MTLTRERVCADHYAVAAGHALAADAAMAILDDGGNAVDAGCAAALALGVLHPDLVNVAGVAPMIIRMAATGEVVTLDGLGVWPAAADVRWFEKQFDGEMPEGLLRTVTPAAPAAYITALEKYGTRPFADIAEAAIRHAREGFEVYPLLAEVIATNEAKYAAHAASAAIYLPGGKPPQTGDLFRQSDLAATVQFMVDEERSAKGSRREKLQAAYRAFYVGDIARTITDYHAANGGLLSREDMAGFSVRFEKPLRAQFAGAEFYSCGAWCQGISLAQAFAMLDADTLRRMEPNSPAYIHYLTEVYKLVFADREQYVADPAFVDVPVKEMLSPEYIEARRGLIDPDHAAPGMPSAGDPRRALALADGATAASGGSSTAGGRRPGVQSDLDTSHACVIDRDGNMIAITPSDTSTDTVVIPGTGLCPSSRGSQSRAIAGHINALAPGKRPRLTPNPTLALKAGKPLMTMGTPGGDVQIQAMTQVAANILCHGMDVQAAIEAPRFATYSFPSSFAPYEYFPGLLKVEDRIDGDTVNRLGGLGHDVQRWEGWTWKAGGVCAVVVDESGAAPLTAGADPRRASAARGK